MRPAKEKRSFITFNFNNLSRLKDWINIPLLNPTVILDLNLDYFFFYKCNTSKHFASPLFQANYTNPDFIHIKKCLILNNLKLFFIIKKMKSYKHRVC